MAIEFDNPLVAGTVLVREAIQSQNYSAGTAGWIIEADGDAELNDVTVRGTLESSNYVAGSAGWHLDDAGSAEFNDVVVRGTGAGDTVIVGPSGSPQVQLGSTAGAGYIELPTNRPIEDSVARLVAGVVNSGLATEYATVQVQGPSVTGADDRLIVRVDSEANDGSTVARLLVEHDDGSGTVTDVLLIRPGGADAALEIAPQSSHTGNILRAALGATGYLVVTNDGRTQVINTNSASSAIFVNTAAGHTGNLLRAQINGTDKLVADNAGELSTYAGNTPTSWTPTITGGGAATLSTADGWIQRLGKHIYVYAYFVIGVAGSGATVVQLNLPFTPWRGSANRRQNLPGAVRDGGYANPGPVAGLVFAGGAGATVNRLVDSAGADVTGAALTAGSIWVFEGWLREA